MMTRTSFEAMGLRKDQQCPAGERAFERLVHRDQPVAFCGRRSSMAACSRVTICTGGHRKQHLAADHDCVNSPPRG